MRRRELERTREDIPRATVVDLPRAAPGRRSPSLATVVPFAPELEQMRLALGLGIRDYVEKSGFREVVLGISGRDRLGADRGDLRRRTRP